MKRLYFSSILLLGAIFSHAQYQQNFDTIINTGTALNDKLPEGWAIYEVGTSTAADGKYSVGTGSANAGNAYSFGSNGSTDRALGTIASNTNFPTIGAIFFNETETPISTITITYTGEQWRYGGRNTGTRDNLVFEYSLDAQGIVNNVGTWTRVAQLDFLSPYIAGTAAVVLDGNAGANRQTITYDLTGLNIQPGESIVIRWSDENITGNDDGLAIDDFSISAGLVPGVLTSGGTNVGGGTGGGGGTTTGGSTSDPIFDPRVATDSSFLHLYGNLHGHTTHSDGKISTGVPADAFTYARGASGMDFLGISEHNHSTATGPTGGISLTKYKQGVAQADAANGQLNVAGNPFIALHGMEWGTISGGGHVLVYGFGSDLVNWETGNNDVFVAKSDYITLFDTIRNRPGAFALLAHPNSSDYTGLTGGYKGIADSAVVGVAVESGPANSANTSYSDYPSSLAYMTYYRNLLKRGYRVGANIDQDNHELTFGTVNGNRLVVLAKDRTREALTRSLNGMRFYASNDYTAQVSFSINNFIMGSSIVSPANLNGTLTHSDAEGEAVTAIQLYGGRVGGADATLLEASSTSTLNFTTNVGTGETWYYYGVITQADGNKIVTSPIWLTRASGAALPVRLLDFSGSVAGNNVTLLKWNTGAEEGADYFEVERSTDMRTFVPVGRVAAKGSSSSYQLQDMMPSQGVNYYRLRQVDKSGQVTYSNIISLNMKKPLHITVAPNPARDVVRLSTGSITTGKVQVQLVDMAGNLVYNQQHNSGVITLDVSRFPNGSYLVRVGDDFTQLIVNK